MKIGLIPPQPLLAAKPDAIEPGAKQPFAQVLMDSLKEVEQLQQQADSMAQKLATGDVEDLHQVMLAVEQASLALQLTVQVRNKIIEAYQEVARMQI